MEPSINRNEILEWRWISRKDLNEELLYQGAQYTPWLKMEWEAINRDHIDQISR
jgi:isopentenyldiphosphate isomerase